MAWCHACYEKKSNASNIKGKMVFNTYKKFIENQRKKKGTTNFYFKLKK